MQALGQYDGRCVFCNPEKMTEMCSTTQRRSILIYTLSQIESKNSRVFFYATDRVPESWREEISDAAWEADLPMDEPTEDVEVADPTATASSAAIPTDGTAARSVMRVPKAYGASMERAKNLRESGHEQREVRKILRNEGYSAPRVSQLLAATRPSLKWGPAADQAHRDDDRSAPSVSRMLGATRPSQKRSVSTVGVLRRLRIRGKQPEPAWVRVLVAAAALRDRMNVEGHVVSQDFVVLRHPADEHEDA